MDKQMASDYYCNLCRAWTAPEDLAGSEPFTCGTCGEPYVCDDCGAGLADGCEHFGSEAE